MWRGFEIFYPPCSAKFADRRRRDLSWELSRAADGNHDAATPESTLAALEFFYILYLRRWWDARANQRERRRFHSLGINYEQSTSIKTAAGKAMNIHRYERERSAKSLVCLCKGRINYNQGSIKTFNGIDHSEEQMKLNKYFISHSPLFYTLFSSFAQAEAGKPICGAA